MKILKNDEQLKCYLICNIAFFIACRQETPLEYALAASGENRKELELFLDYFREDSLKYKAACFLIENMPGAFAVNEEIVSACKPFTKCMIRCRIPMIMILCLYMTSIPRVKTGEGR